MKLETRLLGAAGLAFAVACGGGDDGGEMGMPDGGMMPDADRPQPDAGDTEQDAGATLEEMVRAAAEAEGMYGSPELRRPALDPDQQALIDKRADLGRLLFFDRALSGVEHTSCATCHHSGFGFGDGRRIARGVFCGINDDDTVTCDDPSQQAGDLVGPERTSPLNFRNSPTVINSALFPKQMVNSRFHFVDDSSTDVNALDASLGFNVQGPEFVLFTRSLLAAQAFKPTPDVVEMAGDFPFIGDPLEDDDIRADAVRDGLAERIGDIAEYRTMFEEAYPAGQRVFAVDPEIGSGDPIPYEAIADAIAHWEERDLVMTDAPWDEFLAGDDDAISESAKRGALVFLTTGQCAQCHSGDLFSDFDNHNIGVPQIGPGTEQSDPGDDAYEGLETWDFGFEEISGERGDRFKFRTPPLRGVTLTSPYMHNGAYGELEDAILHHADPRGYYDDYDITVVEQEMRDREGLKPADPVFDAQNPVAVGPGSSIEIELSAGDVDDLIEFMKALTDPRMLDLEGFAPEELPSGLPPDSVGDAEFPIYD